MTDKLMPSLLDREIDTDHDDSFGHRHFAKALKSLIESSDNLPPFSIGLLGKWGSGKSSIKAMYLKSLADTPSNGTVFPITFNAWRFGGEDLKRALLRQVYLATGGSKRALDDALFHQLEETIKRPRSLKEIFADFYERVLWTPIQLLLVIAGLIGLVLVVSTAFDLSNPWLASGVMTGITALGWKLLTQLPELNKLLIARTSSVVRVDAPRSTAEQFEDLLVEQLKSFKKGTALRGKGKKCERLVVFVDDLDRLSSEEMVAGLDAIRTFMEIPLSKTSMGIIFVISCDEDRVAEALFRSKATVADMPGAVFNRSDARRYLDRIFQFRLEIPEFPKRDLRDFAMRRLKSDLPDIVSDLSKSGVSLENVVDRMIHMGVNSPRNAIQILNSFCQCWWIAKRREREGAGTDRAGGLQEGAVTKHPIALAAICALRVDFPNFFHDLQREPDLIERFTAVFIRDESLGSQPEATQAILRRYTDKNGELQEGHRPLRLFIASLGGLRWPRPLQPLLILTQDPITRRLGDKALPLYEAFVSGDHREILRLLGREKNTEPLPVGEVRQLKDMVEDLQRETPVRRDNAAACLAALAERLPKGHAHHLLSPLARRLAKSPELRWRLGVRKIRSVLPEATAEDRRDVADCLVSDLLKMDGDTDFKRDTMQSPSLDEAVEMACEACSLVLWVRKQDGLLDSTEERILRWLEVRRIAVEGKEATLPFTVLEEWLNEHGDPLLLALKERYTHLVADLLESGELGNVEIENLIGRCRIVFNHLCGEGEDSRRILWEQATRFVSVTCPEAASLAWQTVAANTGSPNADEISQFTASLATRLKKGFDNESEWGLDWEAGAEALLTILRERADDINDAAQQAIADLAAVWGTDATCAEYATALLDVLTRQNSDARTAVITDWIGRLFGSLPEQCLDWLAKNFMLSLNNQQRSQLNQRLQQLVNTENIPEQEAVPYIRIMGQFSSDSLSAEPLQSHLTNLCAKLDERRANPNNFVQRVFPAIPNVIDQCPNAALGQMLQQLFVDSKARPKLFGWLHAQMAGSWPKSDESRGTYNPQLLFDEAAQIALAHSNDSSMEGVLRSMSSMLLKGVVEQTAKRKVAEVACKLWPHHSHAALEALQEMDTTPRPQDVSVMLDGVDPNNSEQIENLSAVWSHISDRMNDEDRAHTAVEILSRPMKGNDEQPDLCFHIWVEATGPQQSALLRRLMASDELNDEQRKRTWLQAVDRIESLGRTFFEEVLLIGFKVPDCLGTMRSMLEAGDRISQLFITKDQRYRLGKVLMEAFVAVPSVEIQNGLIEWLKSLDAGDVLKELQHLRPLTEEELDVLRSAFPRSRHLKKVRTEG